MNKMQLSFEVSMETFLKISKACEHHGFKTMDQYIEHLVNADVPKRVTFDFPQSESEAFTIGMGEVLKALDECVKNPNYGLNQYLYNGGFTLSSLHKVLVDIFALMPPNKFTEEQQLAIGRTFYNKVSSGDSPFEIEPQFQEESDEDYNPYTEVLYGTKSAVLDSMHYTPQIHSDQVSKRLRGEDNDKDPGFY